MSDDGSYLITPPPGLLPPAPAAEPVQQDADGDSGTRKLIPSRQAIPVRAPAITGIPFGGPAATPVAPTPAAPGEPAAAAPPTPAAAPATPAATPAAAPAGADDATVLAAPRAQRAAAGWRLALPDSSSVLVDSALVLGRRPSAPAGHDAAHPVALPDDTRSVSKTHALVEVDAGGLWITDLGSTNGTYLRRPGDVLRQLDPHSRTAVPGDSDIELGEFRIQVGRA